MSNSTIFIIWKLFSQGILLDPLWLSYDIASFAKTPSYPLFRASNETCAILDLLHTKKRKQKLWTEVIHPFQYWYILQNAKWMISCYFGAGFHTYLSLLLPIIREIRISKCKKTSSEQPQSKQSCLTMNIPWNWNKAQRCLMGYTASVKK